MKTISNFQFPISNFKRGFTLIEMMVAIGLFVVFVGIAVGGFAQAIRTQRQAQQLLAANSNASLAMEIMARAIRTGRWFCYDGPTASEPSAQTTAPDCIPAESHVDGNITPYEDSYLNLAFVDSAGCEDVYYLDKTGGSIIKNVVSGPAPCVVGSGPLTGMNVSVDYMYFHLLGQGPQDGYPPRVTIFMGIHPNSGDAVLKQDVIQLQTTVSSRQPNG